MGASSTCCGIRGVDISGADGKESWWAGVALSGKLYGVPCSADRLLIYDPETDAPSSGSTLAKTGAGKWRSAAAIGTKVIGLPDRAEYLIAYDVASGKASFVETRSLATGPVKWQSAFALGGKVYGVPYNADRMLVYEVATGKVSGILTTGIAKGPAKWPAGAVLGGKVYGVPCSASQILEYDPVSQKCSGIDISHLACGSSGKLKWLSAVTFGGKLYGIPCHADCILVYDPVKCVASGIDTRCVAKGDGKWMSGAVYGSNIYGIPDHADSILILDTITSLVSGVSIAHIAQGPFKWQSAVTLGDMIYAAPFDADHLLSFDPITREATGVDTSSISSGKGKWGTTLVLGGHAYGIPYNADKLLVYTPPDPPKSLADTNADGSEEAAEPVQVQDLPSDLGKELAEDFVALWLSHWVYRVDTPSNPVPVPPLTLGGLPITLDILLVHEEPLQGSPARLAVVSANLPGKGKVLYFVFKGSSFVTDVIVNANISPDYAPFHRAFGDNTTFVHHGAYHAISQLRVHQRERLLGFMHQAEAEGVAQLIVTGHSLGGQYALAYLLDIFCDTVASDATRDFHSPPLADFHSPLLTEARCVAFGTPMAFGSAEGAEVRKDLVDFFQSRSVNYIYGGDPAPRLWSELDLEGFIRGFSERLRNEIPATLRPLVDWAAGPGGLVKKAEDLMKRPDIESQFFRPARRYVHISTIRLIDEDFKPWRPMIQEQVSIEDHASGTGYIPAFSKVLDPGEKMSLYSESGQLLL